MTFKRARSEEQRELRRQSILDAAAAMLAEMPASELSLNELSRRVGLAKSNVLRYFESREAVLLDLLDQAVREWATEVRSELAMVRRARSAAQRGDRLASVLATSLSRHRVLCDLLASQPGVLEHNVSAEVVLRFKRASAAQLGAIAADVRDAVPELGDRAPELCMMAAVLGGAMWAHAQHSASALAAYELDPALSSLRIELPGALEEALKTFVAGMLARPS